MNEIEQLRADIATLEAAEGVFRRKYGQDYKHYNTELARIRKRLAKLEAEAAAKADPHKDAKRLADFPWSDGTTQRVLSDYARHLEQRVAELEEESRCERIDGGKVHADLKARIAELEAELAKRPVADPEPTKWGGKAGGKWVVDGNGKPLVFQSHEAASYIFADGVEIVPYTGEQS